MTPTTGTAVRCRNCGMVLITVHNGSMKNTVIVCRNCRQRRVWRVRRVREVRQRATNFRKPIDTIEQ